MVHDNRIGWFSAIGVLICIVFLLALHLGFGLIAALFMFTLSRVVWNKIPAAWPRWSRKMITIVFLFGLVGMLGWGLSWGMRYSVKTVNVQKEQMISYSVEALNDLRPHLPKAIAKQLPSSIGAMNKKIDEAAAVFGKNAVGFGVTGMHLLFQLMFAVLIAGACSTKEKEGVAHNRLLRREWLARISEYSACFSTLMTAQLYVAVWNAFCTALFLYGILPLMGVELSFREALVIFTLLISLIPALGNMVANSVMAFLCLPHGISVVIAAIIFLVLVHKAEYLINARIIGQNVQASVPEMLIAILIGERLFGLSGLILGPVTYAYIKMYLIKKELV